jgi:outer membrane biosynthesis protein TonB
MRHKLLVSMAALAIGIAVASCGENEEPASKHSGSTAPQAQQTPSAQAERSGAEKQPKQSTPAEAQQAPPSQTASQPPSEPQKQPEAGQQKQTPQVAGQQQQPSTAQGQPIQAQAQPPQPQRNQPGQNRQSTATPAAGPLNLTRDHVLEAQRLLSQKGFDVGEIDGVIGPRTRRAVIAFQRQQGLEPTGQIDQQTANALGLPTASDSTTGGRSATTARPGHHGS